MEKHIRSKQRIQTNKKKNEKLFSHIKLLNLHGRSQYVCTGDLNNFFYCQLEAHVENPSLSQKIRQQIL